MVLCIVQMARMGTFKAQPSALTVANRAGEALTSGEGLQVRWRRPSLTFTDKITSPAVIIQVWVPLLKVTTC